MTSSGPPHWPIFILGHKMGTHFGHPYRKFDPPMSLPIDKEHHTQILVRIGPTIGIKCGDLDFSLMQPEVRSDLIRSPILGGPQQLLFYATFSLESSFYPKKPFLILGIKWVPLLGTPIKKLPPHACPHWKRGDHANFGKDWSNGDCWRLSERKPSAIF